MSLITLKKRPSWSTISTNWQKLHEKKVKEVQAAKEGLIMQTPFSRKVEVFFDPSSSQQKILLLANGKTSLGHD